MSTKLDRPTVSETTLQTEAPLNAVEDILNDFLARGIAAQKAVDEIVAAEAAKRPG
ncbi:hypothetical protein [Methylobacterium sp. WSM2598]|uniref:hypothetical protein n=1 Tax=Methylobacterium sp. WSM2598 TaxID=398261 RepID=UPI000367F9C0|nr:hypothetical protein [Methylobacterium sp. WSM2598]